jgi:hypothetical protein
VSAASAAVAVRMRRQREAVAAFVGAGAIDAAHARSFAELGIADHGHARALRQLREHAVVRLAEGDRYWVHMATWDALRRRRHRILAVVLIAALVLLALSVLLPTAVGV